MALAVVRKIIQERRVSPPSFRPSSPVSKLITRLTRKEKNTAKCKHQRAGLTELMCIYIHYYISIMCVYLTFIMRNNLAASAVENIKHDSLQLWIWIMTDGKLSCVKCARNFSTRNRANFMQFKLTQVRHLQ